MEADPTKRNISKAPNGRTKLIEQIEQIFLDPLNRQSSSSFRILIWLTLYR